MSFRASGMALRIMPRPESLSSSTAAAKSPAPSSLMLLQSGHRPQPFLSPASGHVISMLCTTLKTASSAKPLYI